MQSCTVSITLDNVLSCTGVDEELGGVLIADLTAHRKQVVHFHHHILLPGACRICTNQPWELVYNVCTALLPDQQSTHTGTADLQIMPAAARMKGRSLVLKQHVKARSLLEFLL